MARDVHLYFLLGDIVAITFVVYVYSLVDAVEWNQAVWQAFHDAIIALYMWMDPLQSVQLHSDSMMYVVIEWFAYGLLVIFMVVVIAIFRNIIGAFSQDYIKKTVFNMVLGGMRNIIIAISIWSLLPVSIVQTYWFQEIYRNTVLFYLLL